MEAIKPNPILSFNENHLLNVRKAFGYDDKNKLKQDIDQLQDWIRKQNHFKLKEFDRDFLERYLIYNKGSTERAKQRFDKLCTFNNLMPEFLQNFDIRNEFAPLHSVVASVILPKPTPDNYRVLMTCVTGEDHVDFNLTSFYRYLIVMGYYMLQKDYCFGYELVGDCTNVTFPLVKKLNPVIIHKALNLVIEAMGQRMKKIHMISGSKFFDTIMIVVKQGLSAKLAQRLVIHPNIESLQQHLSKDILPSDYGGSEKSMRELSDQTFKEMCTDEHIAAVKYMEQATTDEACRVSCKFNEDYSGMPGSFKTLCVD